MIGHHKRSAPTDDGVSLRTAKESLTTSTCNQVVSCVMSCVSFATIQQSCHLCEVLDYTELMDGLTGGIETMLSGLHGVKCNT
jgi:hypothetical protein